MTRPLTRAEIIAGTTAAAPSLDRLEQVVTLREDRVRRARSKLASARDEHVSALIDLCHAKAERTAFIAAQTDEQMRLL